MLDTEDIKKLTEYQLEVFKDVFMTKEDKLELETKINNVQTSLDAVLKDKVTRDQEVAVLNHHKEKTKKWIAEASPQLGLKFEQ